MTGTKSLANEVANGCHQLVAELTLFLVEQGSASLVSYYAAAIPRAFWAGWEWASGQGILLTLTGAVATILVATAGMFIATRPKRTVLHNFGRLFIEAVAVFALMAVMIFGVFFISDAPAQLAAANQKVSDLQEKLDRFIPPPTAPRIANVLAAPTGTSYDRSIELPVLDEIIEILRAMARLPDKGAALEDRWFNALADPDSNPTYLNDLINYRDTINSDAVALNILKEKYSRYEDITHILDQSYYDRLKVSLEKFVDTIIFLKLIKGNFADALPNADVKRFIAPVAEPFGASLAEYRDWIHDTEDIVVKRRKQIQTNK